jgi:hypothetical protein
VPCVGDDCTPPPHTGQITACKFYDFNADGEFDGEQSLSGWPMTISPLDGAPEAATQFTNSSDGCVTWTNLNASLTYTVTEGTPTQTNWFASTPTSVSDLSVGDTPLFGNYCTVPSGGKTLGFWSNKNGQALITGAQLCALNALNLKDAGGSDFNPVAGCSSPSSSQTSVGKTALKNWLLSANATNMAYMLSAQLTAMKLSLLNGLVDGNSFDLCSDKTVHDLVTAANTALGADGYTPAGDEPNRSTQEDLKNCLDALNNNGPVVPTTPCTYSFAQ